MPSQSYLMGNKQTEILDNYPATFVINTDSGSGSASCNTLTPNGKFRCIYRGVNPNDGSEHGECGVRVPSVSPPDNSPRVFYVKPYTTTNTTNTTNAHLTLSEALYGSFDITFYMRTVAQLKTTFKHSWEVAWFMWHFAQAGLPITSVGAHYHHYYLLLKTSGFLEVGRKDIPLVLEPSDYQYFIDNGPTYSTPPTFSFTLGQWNKVRIRHEESIGVGNHITVWIDDVLKTDCIDDGSWGTPSTVTDPSGGPPHPPDIMMRAGHFGFYAEDSEAEYTPITNTYGGKVLMSI